MPWWLEQWGNEIRQRVRFVCYWVEIVLSSHQPFLRYRSDVVSWEGFGDLPCQMPFLHCSGSCSGFCHNACVAVSSSFCLCGSHAVCLRRGCCPLDSALGFCAWPFQIHWSHVMSAIWVGSWLGLTYCLILADWCNKMVLEALWNAAIVVWVFPEKGECIGKWFFVGFNHLCRNIIVWCRGTGDDLIDSLNDILFVKVKRVEGGWYSRKGVCSIFKFSIFSVTKYRGELFL